MKRIISAAALLLLLAVLVSCEAPNVIPVITGKSAETEEDVTVEKIKDPLPVASKDVTFLTSEKFITTRKADGVSEQFKKGYAELAAELLKRAANGKSALISPLSVMTALQMTANGAKGQTLEEMQKVLAGMDTEELNRQLFNYYESLKTTSGAKLDSANAIWITNSVDFHVESDFIDVINNTFRAQIAKAPFTERSTVDAINEWCKKNTGDMIEKILNYDDVSIDTVMVLLNALCFDALWAEQYQEHQCRKAEFNGENGTTKVTMMYSEEYGYIKGEKETGFVKYYKDGNYAFAALLPENGIKMSDYVASLTGERLLSLIENRGGAVDAGLPKFKFDWSASLVTPLAEMGMETVFTERSDLSGLGYTDNNDALAISDVIHKTHIEVDESGTRAAAVTAVIVNKVTSVAPGNTPSVILDRPFVYAIIDTSSNLPIFLGSITDITE